MIRIAELDWPIPFLAPRQLRFILPAIDKVQKENDYGAAVDIVFMALTRAHPNLDKDEFEEWPVLTHELTNAIPVIMKQTGMLVVRKVKKEPGILEPKMKNDFPDWDAVIAEFCNFLTGTTPDYWEDALTIPRMNAQYESWRKFPPLSVLASGYLKYEPKMKVEEDTEFDDMNSYELLTKIFPTGEIKLN